MAQTVNQKRASFRYPVDVAYDGLHKLINWVEFFTANQRMIRQIVLSGREFHTVLIVLKGGMYPAYHVLQHLPKTVRVEVIRIESYTDDNKQEGIKWLQSSHYLDTLHSNLMSGVLAVEDFRDTGATHEAIKHKYLGLAFACTFARHNAIGLDFCGKVFRDKVWRDFGWEVMCTGVGKIFQSLKRKPLQKRKSRRKVNQ